MLLLLSIAQIFAAVPPEYNLNKCPFSKDYDDLSVIIIDKKNVVVGENHKYNLKEESVRQKLPVIASYCGVDIEKFIF